MMASEERKKAKERHRKEAEKWEGEVLEALKKTRKCYVALHWWNDLSNYTETKTIQILSATSTLLVCMKLNE